ncbi:l1 transposable element-related [Holotrichia oblita]|uniref:L1 transposable element-related n=1 Tax=Holotrichia oblita TaxID=644536 RepID=A0ACB9SPL1_HOLOL|nr:l1 transposable element-related [Holotrichia oblita]
MAEYRMLLRSRAEQDKDEDVELIQRIVEKVLVSPLFLEKLVSAVTDKLNICNNELKSCKNNIDSLDKRMLRIEEALDEQEQYSRRNNIRIYGVPEITHENTCEVFVNLCREKLKINITNSDIDCCHRLAGKEGTNKPIIVRFVRRDVKNKVFNDKRKLKGTRIVITEDLTRVRISRVKILAKYLNSKNVFTSNGIILVKYNGKIIKLKSMVDYKNLLSKLEKGSESVTHA